MNETKKPAEIVNELTDEELDKVAGGACWDTLSYTFRGSAVTTCPSCGYTGKDKIMMEMRNGGSRICLKNENDEFHMKCTVCQYEWYTTTETFKGVSARSAR